MTSAGEKYKEFFEDKIDWKFFNYVLDKLLVYEDIDLPVTLFVSMPFDSSTNYIYQYGYNDGYYNPYDDSQGYNSYVAYEMAKQDIAAYQIEPVLEYSICVNDDPKYRGEIYERISSKCQNVRFDDIYLRVIPKAS